MATKNIALRKQYVQITPSSVIITPNDPSINSIILSPPALILTVDPTPDGRNLSLSLIYRYGSNAQDYVACQMQNIDLLDVLSRCPGQTVLEKLNLHFMSLTAEVRNNIMHPVQASLNQGIRYPGQTDNEQFIYAFMIGMAAHLMALCLFKHDDNSIGEPFYPIATDYPTTGEGSNAGQEIQELMNQCMGDYMAIYAKILQAMHRGYNTSSNSNNNTMLDKVGTTWLTIVDIFWQTFADCFPTQSLNISSTMINSALHSALVGYSTHQEKRCESISAQFSAFEENAQRMTNTISQIGSSTMQNVQQRCSQIMTEQEGYTAQNISLMNAIIQQSQQHLNNQSQQMQTAREQHQEKVQSIQDQTMLQLRAVTNDCIGKIDAHFVQGMEDNTNHSQKCIAELKAKELQSCNSMNKLSNIIISDVEQIQSGSIEKIVQAHNDSMNKILSTIEEAKASLITIVSDGKDRVNMEGQTMVQQLTEKREQEIKIIGDNGRDICYSMSEIENKTQNQYQKVIEKLDKEIDRIVMECKEIVADESRQVAATAVRTVIQSTLPQISEQVQSVVQSVIDKTLHPHIQKVERDVAEGLRQCNEAHGIVQKLEIYGLAQKVHPPEMDHIKQHLQDLEHKIRACTTDNAEKSLNNDNNILHQRIYKLESDLDHATELLMTLSQKVHDLYTLPDEAGNYRASTSDMDSFSARDDSPHDSYEIF